MASSLRPVLRSKIGVIRFPGSNCDQDVVNAIHRGFGFDTVLIWHTETNLPPVDAIILPGGFSYGDYLRSGALAAHSPVMTGVKAFAKAGGPVLGICNGFQVLTESRMLPGALLRNQSRRFICRYVHLIANDLNGPYQSTIGSNVLALPIAHGEGRYYIDQEGLKVLQQEGRIAFRYCDHAGQTSDASNPNGSVFNIAGILNETGRVCGMMPHPERATESLVGGSSDGLKVLKAFLATVV